MEIVYLCNIPELDLNYENVFDFPSATSQKSYFQNKVVKTATNVNVKEDTERTMVVLSGNLREFEQSDYLFFTDENGKTRYYFITGKEMRVAGATTLYLQLDVWSTYLFNHELMESFIERCHVDRWKTVDGVKVPIQENTLAGENMAIGDYVLTEDLILGDVKKSYIINSNVPLGKLGTTTFNEEGEEGVINGE